MNIFRRLWMIAARPGTYFSEQDIDVGYWSLVTYYALASCVVVVVRIILNYSLEVISYTRLLERFPDIAGAPPSFMWPEFIGGLIGSIVVAAIGMFMLAGIFHLFVLLLGGREGYKNTFRVAARVGIVSMAYAVILLVIRFLYLGSNLGTMLTNGWVVVSTVHVAWLWTAGLSVTQKISKIKSFLVWLIPVVAIVLAYYFLGPYLLYRYEVAMMNLNKPF